MVNRLWNKVTAHLIYKLKKSGFNVQLLSNKQHRVLYIYLPWVSPLKQLKCCLNFWAAIAGSVCSLKEELQALPRAENYLYLLCTIFGLIVFAVSPKRHQNLTQSKRKAAKPSGSQPLCHVGLPLKPFQMNSNAPSSVIFLMCSFHLNWVFNTINHRKWIVLQ